MMKNISLWELLKTKFKSRLLCITMIVFMVLSNVPVNHINAVETEENDDENVTEVSSSEELVHSDLNRTLYNSYNDEYYLSLITEDESLLYGNYRLVASELNRDYTRFEDYKHRAEQLSGNSADIRLYSLSLSDENNNEYIPEGNISFTLDSSSSAHDTQLLILYDKDRIIENNSFEADFTLLTDKPVIALVNKREEPQNNESDIEKPYKAYASYKNTDLNSDELKVKENSNDDEAYSTYINEETSIVDDHFIDYLYLFELQHNTPDPARENTESTPVTELIAGQEHDQLPKESETANKEETTEHTEETQEPEITQQESIDRSVNIEIRLFDGYKDLKEGEQLGIVIFEENAPKLIIPETKILKDEENREYLDIVFDITEADHFALVKARKEITLTYRDYEYLITVVYDTKSNIPSDAILSVSEILIEDETYEDIIDKSSEALGEDKIENASFIRAFDISLRNPDTSEEYQPESGVRVSIDLINEEISEDSNIEVLHIEEEKDEATIIDSSINGETVEFETDGFSVFVVVKTEKEFVLTASDGNNYKITVSYDSSSGIPEDAILEVSEILEDDPGYNDYVERNAEALGKQPNHFSFIHAFDISLVNPDTGVHYQPNNYVKVKIELLNEDVDNNDSVNVVHFAESEYIEILDNNIIDGKVQFESDSFSVYVVTQNVLLKHFVFLNGTDPQADKYSEQVLANGEGLVEPPKATKDGAVFKWWSTSINGTKCDFESSEYKNIVIDPDSVTGSTYEEKQAYLDANPVYFYAVYDKEMVVVTFYNQSGLIVQEVKVDKPGTLDTTAEIYNYIPIQDKENTYVSFKYWTEEKYATASSANAGTLTISADDTRTKIDLYPVLEEGHYLNFDANRDSVDGASIEYIPALFVVNKNRDGSLDQKIAAVAGELEQALGTSTTPECTGYVFQGWYTQAVGGEQVFSPNSDKTLECNESALKGLLDSNGKFPNNPTVFAHWAANPTSTYTIIVWHESVNSNKNASFGDANKKYDYIASHPVTAATGSAPTASDGTTNYADPSLAPTGFRTDNIRVVKSDNTVKADGSTTVNVYFDRKLITMIFKLPSYTQSNSGKYALISNKYVRLAVSGNNARYWSYNGTPYFGVFYTRSGNQFIGYTYTAVTGDLNYSSDYYGVNNQQYVSLTRNSYNGGNNKRYNLTWTDSQTFTGLYGQTLSQNGYTWNKNYDWYDNYAGNAGQGSRTTFLDAFIPTSSDDTLVFYGQESNTGGSTVLFLKQNVDPNTGKAVSGSYSEANSVNVPQNSNFYISDKYNGYTAYQYSINGGTTWTSVGKLVYKNGNWYYNNGDPVNVPEAGLRIRYKIAENDLIFDQNYVGKPANTTVSGIAYTAKLKLFENTVIPQRQGYTFKGWFYDTDMDAPVDFDSDLMPSENLILYAGWEPEWYKITLIPDYGELGGKTNIPNSYSTYFWVSIDQRISEYKDVTRDYIYAGEGKGTHAYEVTYEEPRSALYTENPTDPDLTLDYIYSPGSYVLLGWYEAILDSQGNPQKDNYGQYITQPRSYNFNEAPNKNLTLVAKWKRAGGFYIRYNIEDPNLEGVSYSSIQIPSDENEYIESAHTLVLPSLGSPRGYALDYWEDKLGNHYQPNELAPILESMADLVGDQMIITFTARYKEYDPSERQMADYVFKTNVVVEDGTARFNGNTYTDHEVQKIAVNEMLNAPITPQAPEGYVFKGWYYDRQGTRRFDGFGRITHPIYTTLYAVYSKVWTVKYYLTNAETGAKTNTVLATQTYNAEGDPEKLDTRHIEHPVDIDHYVQGWTSNGTDLYDYNRITNYSVTSNLELYAKIKTRQYVKFDSQGGSFVDTQEIPDGGWPVRPTAPTRLGYDFLGWYTKPSDDGIAYTFNKSLSEVSGFDGTLYAHWDANGSAKGDLTIVWWAETSEGNKYEYQGTITLDDELNIDTYDTADYLANHTSYKNPALYLTTIAENEKAYFEYSDDANESTFTVDDNGGVLNIRFTRIRYTLRFNPKSVATITAYDENGTIHTYNSNNNNMYQIKDVWLNKEIAAQWPIKRDGYPTVNTSNGTSIRWKYGSHYINAIQTSVTSDILSNQVNGVVTFEGSSVTGSIKTIMRYYLESKEDTSLRHVLYGYTYDSVGDLDVKKEYGNSGLWYANTFLPKNIPGYSTIVRVGDSSVTTYVENGFNRMQSDFSGEWNGEDNPTRILGHYEDGVTKEIYYTYDYVYSQNPNNTTDYYYHVGRVGYDDFYPVSIRFHNDLKTKNSYEVGYTSNGRFYPFDESSASDHICYVPDGSDPWGIWNRTNVLHITWDKFYNDNIVENIVQNGPYERDVTDDTVFISFYYSKNIYNVYLYLNVGDDEPYETVQVPYQEYVPDKIIEAGVINPTSTVAGKEFKCWSSSPSSDEEYTHNMPANNVILYARWQDEICTVTTKGVSETGDANNTAVDTIYTIAYGKQLKVLDLPTPKKVNEIFSGWQIKNNDGTFEDITMNYVVKGDIDIYPKWEDLNVRSVKYHSNFTYLNLTGHGQHPVDNNQYRLGSKINILGSTGENALYVERTDIDGNKYNAPFAYWNTKPDGSGQTYYPSNTFVFYEDTVDDDGNPLMTLNLYAIYSEYRETYLLYDKNGEGAQFVLQDDLNEEYTNAVLSSDLNTDNPHYVPKNDPNEGRVRVLFRDILNPGWETSFKHKPNDTFFIGDDEDVLTNEKEDEPNISKFTVKRTETVATGMINTYVFAGWTDSNTDLARSSLPIMQNGDRAYVNTIEEATTNILYAVWGICKIKTEEFDRWGVKHNYEHVFPTISAAVAYVNSNPKDAKGNYVFTNKTATIEMLIDYYKPNTDQVIIPAECNITLTTATDGKFKYSGTTATITRAQNLVSMFVSNGTLTLNNIIIDGNNFSNTYVDDGIEYYVYGGIVDVAGRLNIENGAILRNSRALYGGAVYVKEDAVMTMNAGIIKDNNASAGAGIYLKEGSRLELSGNPAFENNLCANKEQDIYIDGYLGVIGGDGEDKNNPKPATSLVVTGALTSDTGSIMVGAEIPFVYNENNHYEGLRQFAIFADGNTLDDEQRNDSMRVFRNAVETAFLGTNGAYRDYIYWDGGNRKVILRKTNSSYESLVSDKSTEGATFTIYKGSSLVPYVLDGVTLTGLAYDNGVFFVGVLPYGVYFVHEQNVPSGYAGSGTTEGRWFYVIIDADMTREFTGYESRSDAEYAYEHRTS